MARLSKFEAVHAAGRRWVESALKTDGSLFTPDVDIWSQRWLDEIRGRLGERAGESLDLSWDTIESQLRGADPAVVQLMAEFLFVAYLPANEKSARVETKRRRINQVLRLSPETASLRIPEELVAALGVGFGDHESRLNLNETQVLIRFTHRWKALPSEDRENLLRDPWAFRDMLRGLRASRYYRQRNSILYLVHPETFEPITLGQCKQGIVKRYGDLVKEDTDDVDRQLLHIREALTTDHGSDFDFHDESFYSEWSRFAWPPKKDTETTPSGEVLKHPSPPLTLEDLAHQLSLRPVDYLRRIERLLGRRRQVIFYGPPGTGKTYVARELAAHLAGDKARVDLVQFHPSYAYEDFVEGYRPAPVEGGVGGFELRVGPLKRIARRAEEASDEEKFVLIIDEINRGNLSKVLGELYFLLEYRDEQISLQYSDDLFSLPDNLWIIGTMNTADRSIALVDSALRRRFHFLPFFPDEPPIEGLLARWLKAKKPEMTWVADVLDLANQKLGRRHTAIGPSHFMHMDLNEEWVELIWEHSVLPYIAEQFFGEDDRLGDFALARLCAEVGAAGQKEEHGETPDDRDLESG